jgi:hypothetical protein
MINASYVQQMCEKRGGNLAMTYKPADFDAITHIRQQLVNTAGTHVWIAGTEAKWVMPDGNNIRIRQHATI